MTSATRGRLIAALPVGIAWILLLALPSFAAHPSLTLEQLYLHTDQGDFFDAIRPTSTSAKFKDSPALAAQPYREIGRWAAAPSRSSSKIHALGAVQLWLGLTDRGPFAARYAVRVELLKNGQVVGAGENPLILGSLLNNVEAREILVPLFVGLGTRIDVDDVLSLRVLGRLPSPGGTRSPPRLRLFYDARVRDSHISLITSPDSTAPVASAGPDQTVPVGTTVTLNGSGSTDADGDALTFNWSFVSVPNGSNAVLSNPQAVGPTFHVDLPGAYHVRLIVNDGTVDSVADIVIISTLNSRPVANAGPDQTTLVQQAVMLDGSRSSDADGNPLTFGWSVLSRPAGSVATLQNPTSVSPTFVPDVFGDYVIQLVVNDGLIDGVPDTVLVSTANSPPAATAGANQTAFVGDTIVLDGAGSTDADGNALTYRWSLTSRPGGSVATLQNSTSVNPSFVIDAFGEYVVQLIVNDGLVDSAPATVTVSTLNSPPVARAGPDQSVFVGDSVQLNGGASTDVDGNTLTFSWSIVSQPPNSTATLSALSIVNPTFVVDLPGTYVVQLVVNDGAVNGVPDTVSISTLNRPPVAEAGPAQTVLLSSTVRLDGSASSDPDGNALTYMWSILSAPVGSSAVLSDPHVVNPTFVADRAGTYVAQLSVNDGSANSPADTVSISTLDSIPIANAGPDQSVFLGAVVRLDGGASFDPDGSPLSYAWALTTVPAGSNATLSDPASATPTFTADRRGIYIGQLMVSDGALVSTPDTVQIEALNRSPVAQDDSALTAVDTPVIINVLTNDGDPDGDALTLTAVSQGSNGSVTHTTTRVTYTPASNFNGLDSFTYTVSDGNGGTAVGTVNVTVNRAPIVNAGADQVITLPASASPIGSVTDDGLPTPSVVTLGWGQVSGPGIVGFGSANAASTTASFSQSGVYVLRLTASDGALSTSDDVRVTVDPAANREPSAVSDSALTAVNTPVQITVLANDSDPDGDRLSIVDVTQGGNGAVTHNGTVTTYTPSSDVSGTDTFTYTVDDGRGGSATATVTVNVDRGPQVDAGPDQVVALPASATLAGSATDDGLPAPPGALAVIWSMTSGPAPVSFGNVNAAATTATFSQPGFYVLRLSADDGYLSASDELNVNVTAPGGSGVPVLVAPPVDPTVPTTVFESTRFLYTGADAVQTGVAAGAIEERRSAVVRGRVLARDGTPLAGATIRILNHAELGQTRSRSDGQFDMAVNGGGLLTIDYSLTGHLPVQRHVDVPWQDFVTTADVVLIPRDGQVTTVAAVAATMQVARGGAVSDSDGTRRATVLFPAGTGASIVLPNGTLQAVPALNIRATEYTVGASGPNAMPGELPPTSAYTYAVELSADEAVAKVAGRDVVFTQPVPIYLENFLALPVGVIVPAGYYDPDRAAWVPSANGRVIRITAINGGIATVDTVGTRGLPAVILDSAELQTLGSLYPVGQELWRVPVPHFSTWDFNFPAGGPADAIGPDQNPEPDEPVEACTQTGNSTIECQNQILGESIGVVGTPFGLHYQSERVPGRRTAFTLQIPLSGSAVPASLEEITLGIQVAGRLFQQTFAPLSNQRTSFTWDGNDAYGRALQGPQPIRVRIGYVYRAVYNETAQFGAGPTMVGIGVGPARDRVSYVLTWEGFIGTFNARAAGLGGWTLSPHHAYVPGTKELFRGDGRRENIRITGPTISTVAGTGISGFTGNGGLATAAQLVQPVGLAFGPDGSMYMAHAQCCTFGSTGNIRRVDPAGIITTVAGTGAFCTIPNCGDDGPAINAQIGAPRGLAVGPDSTIYVAERPFHWVRKIGPDGIIRRVAGTGVAGFSGDGGPAHLAQLNDPASLALGPDGTLYILDRGNQRIRRVGPDGIITTVAGTGVAGFSGDGGLATLAQLGGPQGIAVGRDGSLYIVGGLRVRRVTPDGIIRTIAGTGVSGFSGDGGPATQARFASPVGVAVGADDSVYVTDQANFRIRWFRPGGAIDTLAGTGLRGTTGDNGPARQAQVQEIDHGLAVGPDGAVYFGQVSNNTRVRRISPLVDRFVADDIVPAADGTEVYIFTAGGGRHVRTVDALTGSLRYEFAYDSAGRLTSVTDVDGNVTTIQRDGNGNAMAIVGPFGQSTALAINSNGYLGRMTSPAGENVQATYTTDGLLTSFTNPRGHSSSYTFDTGTGRLTSATDPTGATTTLTRSGTNNDFTVTLTSPLGRATVYRVERLNNNDLRLTTTDPAGVQVQAVIGQDGRHSATNPDGTRLDVVLGPDPRWGMRAPLATSMVTTTPGGRIHTTTTQRTVTLANPLDPLSLATLNQTVTINGRVFTSIYNATTRTLTQSSPAGRQTTIAVDSRSKPVQAQFGGLAASSFAYDPRGRLASTTEGSGAGSRTATLAYGVNGLLQSVTDAANRTSSVVRDANGRTTALTFPDGGVAHFGYDANGNLTSLRPPGRPDHLFAYTQNNQASVYAAPIVGAQNTQTLASYNADRQPIQVDRPDVQSALVQYDHAGRPSLVDIATGDTLYSYDAVGRLAAVARDQNVSLAYTYDGGLPTDTTWSGAVAGSVSRAYDDNFRVTSLSVNGSNPIALTYDLDSLPVQVGALTLTRNAQNGLVTGTTLGTISETMTYDVVGDPATYTATQSGSAVYSTAYTRDALGRIASKSETISGATDTFAYTYDLARRLTEVRQNGVLTSSYSYDANGNRLGRTDGSGTTNATYDAQDRLEQFGSTIYVHNDAGERQSKTSGGQTTSYQYDTLGNLIGVTLPGVTQIGYLLDGRQRRVGKSINGTLAQGFLYQDGLKPIAELDGTNNVVSRFVYSTGINVPAYMIKAGVTYTILTDHLGSPRLVIDAATGSIAQRLDYDEFGRVTQDTSPGFQPFGFAGGLYDPDTRLIRYGLRDYDPETGRWTTKDPGGFASGTNLYIYADNDPVNLIDPLGNDPVDPLGATSPGVGSPPPSNPTVNTSGYSRDVAAAQEARARVQAFEAAFRRDFFKTDNAKLFNGSIFPRSGQGLLPVATNQVSGQIGGDFRASFNTPRTSFRLPRLPRVLSCTPVGFALDLGIGLGNGINHATGLSDKMSDLGVEGQRWAESQGAPSDVAFAFGFVATYSPVLGFLW